MAYQSAVLKNKRTGEKIVLPEPTEKEIGIFDDSVLIVEIDLDGYITYANRRYIKISGFPKETLIGAPYTIDRHPDMPEGLFAARDKIISQKKVWRGYVKNMTKDGSFYWTITYMQPKLDRKGQVVGYILTMKEAYTESVKEIKALYEKLRGEEHVDDPFFMHNELYIGDELATFS